MKKQDVITSRNVAQEIAAMAREFYIAEISEEEESFKIKFLNGQAFTVVVREDS